MKTIRFYLGTDFLGRGLIPVLNTQEDRNNEANNQSIGTYDRFEIEGSGSAYMIGWTDSGEQVWKWEDDVEHYANITGSKDMKYASNPRKRKGYAHLAPPAVTFSELEDMLGYARKKIIHLDPYGNILPENKEAVKFYQGVYDGVWEEMEERMRVFIKPEK